MLLPKKTKHRKVQRGRRRGTAKGQTTVQFGDYGLKALKNGWLTNRQIEAARIAMTQGLTRALGRRCQAGSRDVRARRRARGARQGSAAARGEQVVREDEDREAGG